MGMFDDVKYDGRDFQTKDFECEMHQYRIEGGRLLRRQVRWGEGDNIIEDPPLDIGFHGWLNFYRGNAREWEEYNAKFTDGNLVEIIRVPNT